MNRLNYHYHYHIHLITIIHFKNFLYFNCFYLCFNLKVTVDYVIFSIVNLKFLDFITNHYFFIIVFTVLIIFVGNLHFIVLQWIEYQIPMYYFWNNQNQIKKMQSLTNSLDFGFEYILILYIININLNFIYLTHLTDFLLNYYFNL